MARSTIDSKLAARLYVAQRLTLREIGARLGVSHTAVQRALTAEQVERRPPGSTAQLVSPERAKVLLEAYQAGMPLETMRQVFRVADKTVTRLAAEAGLPPRERGGPRRLDWDQIEQLDSQGWPAAAIAVMVGATVGHVRFILRRMRRWAAEELEEDGDPVDAAAG